jgi:hypothetical protein
MLSGKAVSRSVKGVHARWHCITLSDDRGNIWYRSYKGWSRKRWNSYPIVFWLRQANCLTRNHGKSSDPWCFESSWERIWITENAL